MPKPRIIEVVNKTGIPTGQLVDVEVARQSGLWYRTTQLALYTADGQVLVQKRSATTTLDPRFLDISTAAIIYPGETPEQTVVRRTREELGLVIDPDKLQSLGQYPFEYDETRADKTNRQLRSLITMYILELPSANVNLKYIRSEVAWAGFISLEQARQLIQDGELEAVGRLQPHTEVLYLKLLEAISASLSKKQL